MRLWTLHPRYLDPTGLVALWREALLARAVLRGKTRGYLHHPQLHRFLAFNSPRRAINIYLASIFAEAQSRGYAFDRSKFVRFTLPVRIDSTDGQLAHEWQHLMAKLRVRHPALHRHWKPLRLPEAHPLFSIRPGPIEDWERTHR